MTYERQQTDLSCCISCSCSGGQTGARTVSTSRTPHSQSSHRGRCYRVGIVTQRLLFPCSCLPELCCLSELKTQADSGHRPPLCWRLTESSSDPETGHQSSIIHISLLTSGLFSSSSTLILDITLLVSDCVCLSAELIIA